jgi:hypothetical protein
MHALAWFDWVGLGGTLVILAAYFLMQGGRIGGTDPRYQLFNAIGSAGVLVSLLGSFNLSVFLLESAWLLISTYGLARSLRAARSIRPD